MTAPAAAAHALDLIGNTPMVRLAGPSTAHRILGAMCDQRMVERVHAGSYKLGIRLLRPATRQT